MLIRTPFSIKDEKGFYFGLTDEIFKSVYFGGEDDLTRFFLQKILNEEVLSIKREANELLADTVFGKKHLLDALFTINDTIICNIEINTSYKNYIHNRNFAFSARLYSDYARKGGKYTDEMRVVHVDISCGLPKKYNNDSDFFKSQSEDSIEYIQNFVIIIKNMDKIMEHWYNRSDTKEYPYIDEYAYLIVMALGKKDIEDLIYGPYLNAENKSIIERIGRKVIAMNNSSSWYTPLWTAEEDYLYFVHHESRELAKKEAPKMAKKLAKKMATKMASEMATEMASEMATEMAKEEAKKIVAEETQKIAENEMKKRNNDLIKRMLNMNLDVNTISKYLDISVNEIEKVKLTLVS